MGGILLVLICLIAFPAAGWSQSIQIVSPNGGEYWIAGSTYPITWTSSDLDEDGQIYIYLGYDNSWHMIFGPLSTGFTSVPWTIPNPPPTTSGLIFVGNSVNGSWEPGAYSQSAQPFTIMIIGNPVYVVAQVGECGNNSPCLQDIQNAITQASSAPASMINISQETYVQDITTLTLNSGQVILLQGGWDTSFTSQSSVTTIQGSITISAGTMILGNIIVK